MTPDSNIDWPMWALRGIMLAAFLALAFFVSTTDNMATGSFELIVIAVVAAWIYFTPTIVAYKREHLNRQAIFTLNLLTGFLIIPWVIALVWAYKNDGIVHVAHDGPDGGVPCRGGTRTCPYCAEQIKPEAIKCRFCQSEVIPTSPG